jgi:hypothetical protein
VHPRFRAFLEGFSEDLKSGKTMAKHNFLLFFFVLR